MINIYHINSLIKNKFNLLKNINKKILIKRINLKLLFFSLCFFILKLSYNKVFCKKKIKYLILAVFKKKLCLVYNRFNLKNNNNIRE